MSISIDIIKQLREITMAPLWDCKKVLEETHGDIEQAKELLRQRWIAKASKKGDRETHNGIVLFSQHNGSIVGIKVLCETDFVAKNETFIALVRSLLEMIKQSSIEGVYTDNTIDLFAYLQTKLDENVATIGERLVLWLVYKKTGQWYAYNHMGNLLSSVVFYEGWNEELAKAVALQVAAMNPSYRDFASIPSHLVEQRKQQFLEELVNDPKPLDIKEKIIQGKLRKFFQDDVLLDQLSIKDQTKTVAELIWWMKVISYERFSIG